jgi:hypothetical protein
LASSGDRVAVDLAQREAVAAFALAQAIEVGELLENGRVGRPEQEIERWLDPPAARPLPFPIPIPFSLSLSLSIPLPLHATAALLSHPAPTTTALLWLGLWLGPRLLRRLLALYGVRRHHRFRRRLGGPGARAPLEHREEEAAGVEVGWEAADAVRQLARHPGLSLRHFLLPILIVLPLLDPAVAGGIDGGPGQRRGRGWGEHRFSDNALPVVPLSIDVLPVSPLFWRHRSKAVEPPAAAAGASFQLRALCPRHLRWLHVLLSVARPIGHLPHRQPGRAPRPPCFFAAAAATT